MFIALQLPFADIRPFLPEESTYLRSPTWPLVEPGRHFIHGFGPVRRRVRGGLAEWPGEEVYCLARNAFRFEGRLRRRILGPNEASMIPFCAFRRFLSDGGVISRIEVGFRHFHRGQWKRPLQGAEILKVIDSTLRFPVNVPSSSGLLSRSLIESDRVLSAYYLTCTTKKDGTPNLSWVSPGRAVTLVEYRGGEITDLPKHTRRVEGLEGLGIQLGHCWMEVTGRRVGVWFMRLDSSGHRLEKTTEGDVFRRMRLNLFRLHADYECFRQTMLLVRQQRLKVEPGSEASNGLQLYIRDAVWRLLREERNGLPQSKILKAAQQATDLVSEGERVTLLAQLEHIRPNIRMRLEQFMSRGEKQVITYYISGGQQQIVSGGDPVMGGQVMEHHEINFGNNTVVTGNAVVANTIQNSYNQIQASSVSAELKEGLKQLSLAVAEMTQRLPTDKAEQAVRDLDTLTREVTSSAPRRKWFELSAEGLVETAKTLGEIAGPVVKAVQAILPLLAHA